MRRDGTIMALLRERQMPSAQSKWHLEPEDMKNKDQKEAAELLTDIVAATPRFTNYRLQLLEAAWFGRYGNQHAIGKRSVKGLSRYVVYNHQPVHGDKFVFRYDGTPGVLISQMWSKSYEGGITEMVGPTDPYLAELRRKGALVLPAEGRGLALWLTTPQWRERFAIHMHEAEDADFTEPELAGGIYGTGLRARAYYLWWLRQEVLSWLIDYLARVGAGGLTLIGYEQSNDASLENARDIGAQLETGNVILVPKPIGSEKLTSTIDRVEPSQAGSQVLIEVVEKFFDAWLERLIVGQSMSAGADNESGLGGSGRAQFASNTKFNLVQFDACIMDECITEQLVQPLKRWNFPEANFRIKFVSDLTKPDQDKQLEAAGKAYEMGCEFIESELVSLTGLSVPQPGDKTVSKAKSEPQQPGMPGAAPIVGDDDAKQMFEQSTQDGSLFDPDGLKELQGKLSGQDAAGAKPAQANEG